jgi:hypothetical protein
VWSFATVALAMSPAEAVRADAVSADVQTIAAACSATGVGSTLLAGAGLSGLPGQMVGAMMEPTGLYRVRLVGESWVEVTLPLKAPAHALMQLSGVGGEKVDGGWRISQGEPLPTRPADLGLLAGFDERPGCVMYMESKDAPRFSAGLQLPETGPLLVRVRGVDAAPTLRATARSRGARPTTVSVPDATLRLGVDGTTLLGLLPMLGDEAPAPPAGADRVAKRIDAGVEIGWFEDEIAGVVPLRGFLGGPGRGRIKRALTLADEVTWTDEWGFSAEVDQEVVYGTVERGRLLFATSPTLLLELGSGEGDRWIPAPAAHAVALEIRPGARIESLAREFGAAVREPWSVVLDAADGYWLVSAETGQDASALLQGLLAR